MVPLAARRGLGGVEAVVSRKGGDWLARETEIRALRLSGWPVLDVAAEVGVVPQWVVAVCAGLGVSTRGSFLRDDRRDAAVRLLVGGASNAEVRARLGLGGSVVSRIAAQLGLSPHRGVRKVAPERRQQAEALLRAGTPTLAVAQQVRMSLRTVCTIRAGLGLPRRGPVTPPATPPALDRAARLELIRQRARGGR